MRFIRRETFAFDRILYRDNRVEVTPSMLMVGGGILSRSQAIDVENICGVWQPVDSTKQLLSKPRWWRRAAIRERVLARAPRRRQTHNLMIDVREKGRVSLCAERPDELAHAINKAQMTLY